MPYFFTDDSFISEGTGKDDYGLFGPQVTDDTTNVETWAGTDNLQDVPSFVHLNAGKIITEDYEGFIGGEKGTVIALEEGIELIPFDNPKNWLGFTAGTDIKQGVVQGAGYLEGDDGFAIGSFGAGGGATAAQANIHAKLRFDEFNISVNIGGDLGGAGAMVEGSFLDKRSDGTYRILSVDGILQYVLGVNVNVDIYLEDRDHYLQNN